MIDRHESVIIIGLKVNHFFCEVEKVQIGRFSSDSLNMSTVSVQVHVILLLLRCSFAEFEEKSSGCMKNLRIFFSIKAEL